MTLPARLQNALTTAHIGIYRASGGRLGRRFRGAPVLLLEHVGRKSGAQRTTPLIYARDGDDIVLVASNGGARRTPAWFHNITAAGTATVQVASHRYPVTVRTADDAERARLWPQAVAVYADYDAYQRRTERQIPVVVLTRS